jgi:tetratricopeptide (TPR) repeat protein
LSALPEVEVGPLLQAQVHFARAAVHLARGRHEKTIAECDLAAAIRPDMPALHLLRAGSYNALGKHDLALKSATEYIDLLGDDADGFREQGDALRGIGRRGQAAEAYRRGLTDDPGAVDCIVGLANALPRGKKDNVVPYVAKVADDGTCFRAVADALADDRDAKALRALINDRRKRSPNDRWLNYYEAKARE